jgi:hypothetical protein
MEGKKEMTSPLRDLIVLLKQEYMSPSAIEQEVECLHEILAEAESWESFFAAHELIDRNRITSNRKRIRKAIRNVELKPFRFLVNKN